MLGLIIIAAVAVPSVVLLAVAKRRFDREAARLEAQAAEAMMDL